MKNLLIILMLVFMAGCSGPTNKDTCIPSRDKSDATALDGTAMASVSELDKKLEEAKIISTIVQKLKDKIVGDSTSFSGAQNLFSGIVSNPMIQQAISATFSLYVIIFGILVLSGMVNVTIGEMVIRVAKIGFVAIFALNWADFYDFIGRTSMEFTDELLGYFLDGFSQKFNVGGVSMKIQSDVFNRLDIFIAKMFSMKMVAMISALFFASGSSGPIYAIMILLAAWFVFKAILTVVLVYCFSLFARAMLFALAPLFIAFMLFKPTQPLFESWTKQLVNYSLQPVMTAAFLGFFLVALEPFFDEFLKYQFCWQATDATKETYNWVFIDPATNNKVDFGVNSKPAIEIQRILLFLGFGYIFLSATKLGQNMAAGLSGTVAGNLLAAADNMGGLNKFTGKNSKFSALAKQV